MIFLRDGLDERDREIPVREPVVRTAILPTTGNPAATTTVNTTTPIHDMVFKPGELQSLINNALNKVKTSDTPTQLRYILLVSAGLILLIAFAKHFRKR